MSDENRTAVYKIVSEMLHHADGCGIYPTGKCYDALEKLLDGKDLELGCRNELLRVANERITELQEENAGLRDQYKTTRNDIFALFVESEAGNDE